MKLIPMGGKKGEGRFAIVDDEDEGVNQFSWSLLIGKRSPQGYAHGWVNGKSVMMHRLILGLTDPKIPCDHINGDTLDNRRSNLRIADHLINARNRHRVNSNSTTGVRGVWWDKRVQKYRGECWIGRKKHNVCYVDTIEEASKAVLEFRKANGFEN
jgi:HNH endonuclease